MAFTSDRLYVVRVDDGKAKGSYPLKSVQLAPSDKVNPASFGWHAKFCSFVRSFYFLRYTWYRILRIYHMYRT